MKNIHVAVSVQTGSERYLDEVRNSLYAEIVSCLGMMDLFRTDTYHLLRRNKREKQLGDMLPVQSRMVTVYKPNHDSDKNLSGKESTSLYSS